MAISIFFVAVSLLNAKNDSAIYDEVAHIPAGYSYLTEQDMRINPEHPPLIKNLSALPLLFMNLNFDTTQDFWTKDNVDQSQWNAGRNLLYTSGNNADSILFWSRVPIIILSLLLGLFIFKWVNELAGVLAGLMAFILYSFDPNILGHNHYVTTDIGIAAFITFSFYYFLRFIKNPSWKNAFIGGLFLGLVHLAKFSSVLLLPIFLLILIAYPLIKKPPVRAIEKSIFKTKIKLLKDYLKKGVFAFAVSMLMIWAVYLPNTFNMPPEKIAEGIDYYFQPTDPNIKTAYTREVLFFLNERAITKPLAEYAFGVSRVFQRVAGGNFIYYFGEVSSDGFSSYFPMVFLMKEPIPTLLLFLLALTYSVIQILKKVHWRKNNFCKKNALSILSYLRSDIASFIMFVFIIFYSFLSITGKLNIGIRHLFPIFPFIYILTSKKISEMLKDRHVQFKTPFKISIAILLGWLIIETIAVFPHYLSYFNQAAGGPSGGYRYVTDSNADWGQDLKRLDKWIVLYNDCIEKGFETIKCQCILNQPVTAPLKSSSKVKFLKIVPVTPIDKIRVDYFGGGDPAYYLGKKYLPWRDGKRPIESGWYALSVNFVQESLHDEKKNKKQNYSWLKNHKPIYQVGSSILIYHVE